MRHEAARAFGRLRTAKGFSGRAQARMSIKVREALRDTLRNTVRYSDFPKRTGRAYRIALQNVRVYGVTFDTLRGHIVAPMYIAAHEEGAEILPKRGKFLAIPVGYALRPDGTPKLPGPRSWQNIQKTSIAVNSDTGKAWGIVINDRPEDGNNYTVIYMLYTQAELPAQGFLSSEWDDTQSGLLGAMLGEIMMEEISRINLNTLARVK